MPPKKIATRQRYSDEEIIAACEKALNEPRATDHPETIKISEQMENARIRVQGKVKE